MKENTSLKSHSSEFLQGSSRFHPVPFEILPVFSHLVILSLLELVSCVSSEVSLESDLVDKLGF